MSAQHRLSNIDPDSRSAVCAVCGPVKTHVAYRSGYKYPRCGKKRVSLQRNWADKHKSYVAANNAKWYANNKERARETNREWKSNNPERRAALNKAYKSRRRQWESVEMTPEDTRESADWRQAIEDDPCFYCGISADQMHDDHMNPLSRGGTDHWWNLVRACASCNLRKGAKTAEEFIEEMTTSER